MSSSSEEPKEAPVDPVLKHLKNCPGERWAVWMSAALSDPEWSRALQWLSLCAQPTDERTLRKATHQFIGAARCPSTPACHKLAQRTQFILAWLNDEQAPVADRLAVGFFGLEKLLPCCEGAQDRHNTLKPAVRHLALRWVALQKAVFDAHGGHTPVDAVFAGMLLDACSLVEPTFWYKTLLRMDLPRALVLASDAVEQMPALEISNQPRWKSFSQRWTRLRLKGFLELAGDQQLLAALLKKSAIDDFEAAQAVALLRQTGRGREAMQLAEAWVRAMPSSPVIAQALVELYWEDGWDEEARALAEQHFRRDPHPRWEKYLKGAA